eukprot:scaffold642_cov232-Pinguiococcus_pyrenoidosus.AAC.11
MSRVDHDPLEGKQEQLLEAEVRQLILAQELDAQLPQGIHREHGQLAVVLCPSVLKVAGERSPDRAPHNPRPGVHVGVGHLHQLLQAEDPRLVEIAASLQLADVRLSGAVDFLAGDLAEGVHELLDGHRAQLHAVRKDAIQQEVVQHVGQGLRVGEFHGSHRCRP